MSPRARVALPVAYGVTLEVPLKGGPVVIAKSTDSGTTWTTPAVLLRGSYQTAPTPVVESNSIVYRTMEESSVEGGTEALIIWARNDADLTKAASWQRSNGITCPPKKDGARRSWQEGSAVESADGSIVNVLRVNDQDESNFNVAALAALDKHGNLTFSKFVRCL